MNTPGRLISYKNLDRAYSDHNLILVLFKTKLKATNIHEIIKRDRKNFDCQEYVNTVKEIDWSDLEASDNLDLMNDLFETKLKTILDRMAPVKIVQRRSQYRNWVSQTLKD